MDHEQHRENAQKPRIATGFKLGARDVQTSGTGDSGGTELTCGADGEEREISDTESAS